MTHHSTDAANALLEGEALWSTGRRDEAIRLWTEALAQSESEEGQQALAARLSRAHRGGALRSLAGPILLALGVLALALTGGSRLAQESGDRRTRDAQQALADARQDLQGSEPKTSLEALRGVAERYPGTPAADEARDLAGRFADHLRSAETAVKEALAHQERGDLARACSRLDEALAKDAFPKSAASRHMHRLRDEAARGSRLRQAKEALEEQRFDDAAKGFAPDARDDVGARRGHALARLARLSLRARLAQKEGKPAEAIALLRQANAAAKVAGRPLTDIAPLEQRWKALRHVRARLACAQALDALSRGKRDRAKQLLILDHPPEDEALLARVAKLSALAERGLPTGMLLLPAARFPRGSASSPDELPLALGEIKEPFLMDRREVTRAEFAAFLAASGRKAPPGWRAPAAGNAEDARRPVTGVSWEEASAYAKWAKKRLPTELEWEAAARLERRVPKDEAGVIGQDRFDAALSLGLSGASQWAEEGWRLALTEAGDAPPVGPDPSTIPGERRPVIDRRAGTATVSSAAAMAILGQRRYPWGGFWDPSRCHLETKTPRPAGPAGASPWGVEDLAGSVAEWTASEYLPYAGPLQAANQGKGQRVVRGGSFRSVSADVRTGLRVPYSHRARFDDVGFRCAMSLPAR